MVTRTPVGNLSPQLEQKLEEFERLESEWREQAEQRCSEVFDRWSSDWEPLVGRAALLLHTGPTGRDAHLALLDRALLPQFKEGRLSFTDLFAHALSQHELDLLTAGTAFRVPIIWRWLFDARRRRLIEPLEGGQLGRNTLWDLSPAGERASLRYGGWTKVLAVRARAALRPSQAIIGLLASLLGGAVILEYARQLAPVVILIVVTLLLLVVVDLIEAWWLRRTRRQHNAAGRRMTGPWDVLIELAVVSEAAVQHVAGSTLPAPEPAPERPA